MKDEDARALADAVVKLDTRVKNLGDRFTGGVLDSGTYQFDAGGVISRDYSVPFAAVAIRSRSAAAIVVETATPRDRPPSAGVSGPGVFELGAGDAEVFNSAGHALTIYGPAGDAVHLQVFSRPQPPAWK